jgi:hypothetical protein
MRVGGGALAGRQVPDHATAAASIRMLALRAG